MNDVPSHVRQRPTFEHACIFVKVCVQRRRGGIPDGGCLLTRACMTVRARRINTHLGSSYDGKAYAQPQDDIALRLEALKVCNGVEQEGVRKSAIAIS